MTIIRGEYFPKISKKVLIYYDVLYCDPNSINDGDTVYCDTHQILKFKYILNQRKNLTLITHNSDHYICDGSPINDRGINVDLFTCFDKWYGQNSYSKKNNVISIPIGFENKRWEYCFGPKTDWINQVSREEIEPTFPIYLNCNKFTNILERQKCYNYGIESHLVTVDDPCLSYVDYLRKIKKHKFILSPRGNGLDCHRTWEILMMKRIPVLKREGQLENLYCQNGIPSLFVDDWVDLNNINLDESYSKFSFIKQDYLYFNFWRKLTGLYS